MVVYAIDIDGTIVTNTNGDYENGKPFLNRIKKINDLYDAGHTILYYTARGMNSCNGNANAAYEKYYIFTKRQLEKWGAKHHQLILGKPYYDVLVDDKAINDKVFFETEKEM